MGPAGSSDWASGQAIAAMPRTAAVPPTVVIIERYALLSWQYSHVLDYLGLRLHRVGSVIELDATLRGGAPMALIWELAAGLDSGQVLRTISELDRKLPILLVLDDDTDAPRVIDSTIQLLRITDVTMQPGKPALRDLVEFLFRAGRRRAEFRVLSV